MGCQRCGLSCMGVRVVPLPGERAVLEARAGEFGVRFPFEGPALRLVMGACVFLGDEGCRIHEAYGAEAKPRVCRQFPWVRRGEQTGVDPACGHAAAWTESSPEDLLGLEAARRPELPGGDLQALGEALELTLEQVATTWRQMPWGPWADQGTAGPLRRAGSARLGGLTPPSTWPSWPAGAEAVRRAWRLGLSDRPEELLVGAVVIAADVAAAERQPLFAVWARALR